MYWGSGLVGATLHNLLDSADYIQLTILCILAIENKIVHLQTNLLSMVQVGKLLEALGLHQHKPRFLQESITGEILVECNVDVLTQDLGIRDQGHCTKIIQLIQGKYSPLALMADYSYVRFKSSKTL